VSAKLGVSHRGKNITGPQKQDLQFQQGEKLD
jgi:hypothetical protein